MIRIALIIAARQSILLGKTLSSVLSQITVDDHIYVAWDWRHVGDQNPLYHNLKNLKTIYTDSIGDELVGRGMHASLSYDGGASTHACLLRSGDTFASSGSLSRVRNHIKDYPYCTHVYASRSGSERLPPSGTNIYFGQAFWLINENLYSRCLTWSGVFGETDEAIASHQVMYHDEEIINIHRMCEYQESPE